MRRIWVSILIMAVTLALALGNGWYLQRLTGGMALELENAQILAEEGNLDGARELTGQVYDCWQSRQTDLCVVARHGDTGEIQTAFQEVLQLLRWPDELPEYAAANARLQEQLGALAALERFSGRNLF